MKVDRSKSGDALKSENRLAAKAPEKQKKSSRKTKDPNKPKRPPTAFFVFMEQFRKEFKEKNPNNKLVSVVGKAGGAKWKSMSDSEKAPYVAKADKLKDEYLKKMCSYNGLDGHKKSAADDESSDKSKSGQRISRKRRGGGRRLGFEAEEVIVVLAHKDLKIPFLMSGCKVLLVTGLCL